MTQEDLMFAAAVQAAARVNRDRELAAELQDVHPSIRDSRIIDFNKTRPMKAFMVGAYREIMEAKAVVANLKKLEIEALLSGQNSTGKP